MTEVTGSRTAESSADGGPAHRESGSPAKGSVRDSEPPKPKWGSSKERSISRARYIALSVVGFLLILTVLFVYWVYGQNFSDYLGLTPHAGARLGLFVALVGAVVLSWGIVSGATARARYDAAQKALGEVDEALDEVTGPKDILGLMRANRKQMNAYDTLARSQAQTSYNACLVAMGIGLLILGAGIVVAILGDSDATKYAAAIVTASGAAVSGLIANTFINVYRHASKQLNFYFRQPLVQSYLLSAERLAGHTPDPKQYAEQVSVILAVATAQAGQPAREEEAGSRDKG